MMSRRPITRTIASRLAILSMIVASIGCSSRDGVDGGGTPDTSIDTGTSGDGGGDSSMDSGSVPDAAADASPDAVADAAMDAAMDAVSDAVADAAMDSTPDAVMDATPDAIADATPDAIADTGPDAAPGSMFVDVTMCMTGAAISEFCGAGRFVSRLRRCDGTFFTPSPSYQMFLLCACPGVGCAVDPSCVAWAAVECSS